MVDISSQNNKINITVSSSSNTANTNVTPDYAQYYSEKSKEWAISNRIVDNTDYSSKYYANESKKQADISTAKATEVIESGNNAVSDIEMVRDNAITDITNQESLSVDNVNTAGATQIALATEQANIATEQATIATNKTSEVVESGNTALNNIDTAKNNAITSITNQETTSKTSLIDEGATQIGLIQNEGATQVANVQSTGFYMRDDKLYYINSQGEETEFKSGGSGLELCDIGTALYVDETKGLRRRLNGSIMDITSNYQAFLTRLLEIKTTNPDYFTDEATWQSEATLNVDGCVYKFVLNYAEDGETVISVRLPKYPDYIEVDAGNVAVKGNGMTLGLSDGNGHYVGTGYNTSDDIAVRQEIYGKSLPSTYSSGTTGLSNQVNLGLTTDPTKSGIVGTLTQTKLKLRYFIQIATGSETENNIINDIELNNPYSLFDYKYSPFELNNISWLKSNGQWNAKAVYTDAYDKLLKVYNGTETVEGLSVKLSTEAYTNYDFVINTSNETFRLPLDTIDHPINSTGTLPVRGNGMTLGLTNGTTNAGFGMNPMQPTNGYGESVGTSASALDISTYKNIGVTTDPTKSGIVADLTSKKANLYLYFYVGETVQNANLIDAGRIGEILPTKTDKVQAAQASMPSNKYIDLTLNASGSIYTAPANGYVYFSKVCTANGQWAYIQAGITVGGFGGIIAGYKLFAPIKKGEKFIISYNLGGATEEFRFYYAEGSK